VKFCSESYLTLASYGYSSVCCLDVSGCLWIYLGASWYICDVGMVSVTVYVWDMLYIICIIDICII